MPAVYTAVGGRGGGWGGWKKRNGHVQDYFWSENLTVLYDVVPKFFNDVIFFFRNIKEAALLSKNYLTTGTSLNI